MTSPVFYTPDIEQPLEDEEALMTRIEAMMVDLAKLVHEKRGHAFHGTHAKLTGLLTGTFDVLPDLPPELAQGLFATPKSYDAIVRYAHGPPEPVTDKAGGQRGLSIKVLGVEGERLSGFEEKASQDWVLGLGPSFTAATARDFERTFRKTGAQSPHLPEPALLALSRAARGAEAILETIGLESANLKFFGLAPAHPVSQAFYSQAAVRYGDHVAKLAAFPTAETLAAIASGPKLGSGDDASREAAAAFFAQHWAVYDIKVQLCTDIDRMPVEDTAVNWPETDSPYRTVARLTLPPQRPWMPERAACDDRLAFNPGHALRVHQPLGSIMRARMRAYLAVQRYRQSMNAVTAWEPTHSAQIPDG